MPTFGTFVYDTDDAPCATSPIRESSDPHALQERPTEGSSAIETPQRISR